MSLVKYPREMEKKDFKFIIRESVEYKDCHKVFLDLKALNATVYNKADDMPEITVTSSSTTPIYHVSFDFGLSDVAIDIPAIPADRNIIILRRNEVTNILAIKKHFNCPDFYFSRNPGDIIYDLDPDKMYIYKRFFSANGEGKIYFSPKITSVLDVFSYSYKNKDGRYLKKIEYREEGSKGSVFPHDFFFIMEDIGYEDILEYRVTLTYSGYYYIQKREGYHGRDKRDKKFYNLLEPIEETIIPKNDMKEILKSFRKIMVELDVPFMSFDLYVKPNEDKNNFFSRYGCFECSAEFGHSLDYKQAVELRKAMTLSLYEFCKNKENKITDVSKRDFIQIVE